MDRAGVSDALVAAGNRVEGTVLRAGSNELGHISLESVPSRYNFVLLVPQNETERILEAHLNALGFGSSAASSSWDSARPRKA